MQTQVGDQIISSPVNVVAYMREQKNVAETNIVETIDGIPEFLDKVMDADAFYTDATFCAMDAFNLGVGQPVLNRQIINSPFDSDKGVSYEMVKPAIEADTCILKPPWCLYTLPSL